MDFYVISPVSNLEPMKLGDRIFALAHLWVQFPEYRKFILEQKEQGKFITLDNSAAERALVTEDVLIDVCRELMPNEVIAPDVLFDKQQTIANAVSFKVRMDNEKLSDKINIFFCPQGATKEDWIDAYKWGLDQDWINVIGLSKIAVPNVWLDGDFVDDQGIKEARHACYDYLKENKLLQKPIHCLGQGDPTEFAYYDHPMMRSTDSVYPVLAAVHGQDFSVDHETRTPTPHNFLEEFDLSDKTQTDIDFTLIEKNVAFLGTQCRIPELLRADL
tara:strand:+ start:915 stop:1736 length:822 start_codon:yes stop_codon:yes gene_type:complete